MRIFREPQPQRFLFLPAFLAIVVLACSGGDQEMGTVDVMGVWSDKEESNFRAMVAPWQMKTKGSLQYTGTRDLSQQVRERVAGDNSPDIVIAPEVGVLRDLVESGEVVTLGECGIRDEVEDNYPQTFQDLGSVSGELYGVVMKVDNKGTIFYNPRVFKEYGWTPLDEYASFDDLLVLAQEIKAAGVPPFSIGIESAEATGWVVTDWIAQILLGQHGLEFYSGVIDGSIPFDSPGVKSAWELFGRVVHTDGFVSQQVPEGVLSVGFEESTYLPFEDPPQAAMVYLGSFAAEFISEQFPDLVAGEDYDYMPFPDGAITGGFSVAYALNDSDTACSFLKHLASAEAQQLWVDAGGFNSVHKDIDLSAYEDPVAKKVAADILDARLFAGDLDDLVAGDFQKAFWSAAIQFLGNPGDLDNLLSSVESAR